MIKLYYFDAIGVFWYCIYHIGPKKSPFCDAWSLFFNGEEIAIWCHGYNFSFFRYGFQYDHIVYLFVNQARETSLISDYNSKIILKHWWSLFDYFGGLSARKFNSLQFVGKWLEEIKIFVLTMNSSIEGLLAFIGRSIEGYIESHSEIRIDNYIESYFQSHLEPCWESYL